MPSIQRPTTYLFPLALCAMLACGAAQAQDYLEFLGKDGPGKDGPGKGKKIALVAGDDEYRSEEGLPMLGKILSQRLGFDCTVLFPAGPDGIIKPGDHGPVSNAGAMERADAIIMLLRFRSWNNEAMQKFETAYLRGVPIIALRTSTHAFDFGDKNSPYHKWTWNGNAEGWKGGFGKQVLGETWVAHHGQHAKEGCRGIIEEANKAHAILNGVIDVFADSDVYTATAPADATILMRGQVTDSLKPDSKPVAGKKNEPMQPVVWTRERKNENGKVNRIVTTTMGAATDLQSEGLRRLIVNSVFWGLKMDVPAKADVTYVDAYNPSFYGFGTERKNFKVEDLGLGKPLLPRTPGDGAKIEKKDDKPQGQNEAPKYSQPEKATTPAEPVALPYKPVEGENIILIGNSLGERDVNFGHIETLLQSRFPASKLTFRNMCNPADTAGFRPLRC